MMPMPNRRLTSLAVRLEGSIYLFDCGEGNQLPYKELHLGLRNLNLIAITHLHADHILGLPGMLMLRSQMPDPQPLTIIGPPGVARFISNVRRDLRMYINYTIDVSEYDGNDGAQAYRDDQVTIYWRELDHRVLCLGYRMQEHDRPGRFDPDQAIACGVPRGPLWGQLQQGNAITTPDGATVQPDQVMGPTRRGRHIAFVTDTAATRNMLPLLHQVDLAFVEGMFAPEEAEDAAEKKHMTAFQAAQLASEAGAVKTVLVHISPRYDQGAVKRLERRVRVDYPQAEYGRDGRVYTVALPP